jgi:excisionase family DNA binding protein
MTDTDLSTWLPLLGAAHAIGCSTRTIERLARAKKLEQRIRPQAGSPAVAVYNPEDVARIATERRPRPAPFVLPAGSNGARGNGQGQALGHIESTLDPSGIQLTPPAGDDPIRQLFAAALRAVLSPPSPPLSGTVSETLWVTVKEAAEILGFPQADVRRLLHDGDLSHRLTGRGGIRIRRKDLEALP